MTLRSATLRLVRHAAFSIGGLCLAASFTGTLIGSPMREPALASLAGPMFEAPMAVARATAGSFNAVTAAGLTKRVLTLALSAASCATSRGVVRAPQTLTVIDYSRPSTEQRLWVIDLKSQEVLYRELVAHGKNTGENLARRFSNELNSLQSSLGLFVTQDTYVGSNGYSLRLNGLERGINDRARERAIVMHGAPYVNEATTSALGRLGRSWGCPALRAPVAREVIDRIKGGDLVFAYYPDQNWLSQSSFLGDCTGEATTAD